MLPSTEVWQLASVGWEAGWEGSEVQQGREQSSRKEPFPSWWPKQAAAPHKGAAVARGCGSQWKLQGVCAAPLQSVPS